MITQQILKLLNLHYELEEEGQSQNLGVKKKIILCFALPFEVNAIVRVMAMKLNE